MSAAVTPGRRLLALLEEEPSLETRPRDEVYADLAAFGIDPAEPIRLARRLADQGGGPAAALLDAMIEDESAEAEIAALESADIAEVRGRLQAGTVAAVTAEAKRRAGLQTNVVGIGRGRRGAIWAWTGSLVGMAACALIVVVAWWPPSQWSNGIMDSAELAPEAVMMREAPPETARQIGESSALSNAETPEALGLIAPAVESEARVAASESAPAPSLDAVPPTYREPPVSMRSDLADFADEASQPAFSSVPQTATSPVAGPRSEPPEPIMEKLAEGEADIQRPGLPAAASSQAPLGGTASPEVFAPPLPPPTPAQRVAGNGALATEDPALSGVARLSGAGTTEDDSMRSRTAPQQDSAAASSRGYRGLTVESVPQPLGSFGREQQYSVTDVLIVDPNAADLTALLTPGPAAMLFEDDRAEADSTAASLSDRMTEARLLVDGRPIVALVKLRSVDDERDVVLARSADGVPAVADDEMRALLIRWFGEGADDYTLIAIPPAP